MKNNLLIICCCLSFGMSLVCTDVKGQNPVKTPTQQYSDPNAPINNITLTVPAEVKPILNVWLRDTYVILGPDSYYYMTGTTATPGRPFPNGRVHCWDYNDGIYLWRSKDMHQWQPLGLIWSFDKDAAEWQKRGVPIAKGSKSVNGD
ncbi:MAG TPA: hypothetical protein VL442_17025, partial [Mucilaginibacter sp.]|nr:hypothetical protein [Mucilaginibacter sp.]